MPYLPQTLFHLNFLFNHVEKNKCYFGNNILVVK